MQSPDQLQLESNKDAVIGFNGGNISSDGGLLLYSELIQKLRLREILADRLSFISAAPNSKYTVVDKIIQQVLFNIAGYEDNIDSNDLAHDTLCQMLLGGKVASQSTLCRHENSFTDPGVDALQAANFDLLKRAYSVKKPDLVIFDIDSTKDLGYGDQEELNFSGYFHHNGYHPLLLFDGITRDLIIASLRPGNVYTSRDAVSLLEQAYDSLIKDNNIRIIGRGDSGFADPKIFSFFEDRDSDYYIRLKANRALYDLAYRIINKIDLQSYEAQSVCGEICYKAASWDVYRRVLVLVKKEANELFPEVYFLCTNNFRILPEQGWIFYHKRGNMENFIKESKLGFFIDRLSCHKYNSNRARFQIMSLAYSVNNLMRRLCFPEEISHHQIDTIRHKIIKIGCKIVKHSRKIFIKLASSYHYKRYFVEILINIQNLGLNKYIIT